MKNMAVLYPRLLLKINVSNVSEQFKLMAQLNGFVTLEDLVRGDLDTLPMRDGSGMKVLKEAIEILQENGLGEFAED